LREQNSLEGTDEKSLKELSPTKTPDKDQEKADSDKKPKKLKKTE